MKPWTNHDQNYLIDRYPDHPCKDIADELGRSVRSVYDRAFYLGLKKSKAYLRELWVKSLKAA